MYNNSSNNIYIENEWKINIKKSTLVVETGEVQAPSLLSVVCIALHLAVISLFVQHFCAV